MLSLPSAASLYRFALSRVGWPLVAVGGGYDNIVGVVVFWRRLVVCLLEKKEGERRQKEFSDLLAPC